jgi:hypothetical protein
MAGITGEIQQNRRGVNKLESYLRVPSPKQSTTLTAPGVSVNVSVSATIYTRPINESLIAGHPDASNQPGRGTVGDNRGSWTQVATSEDSEFTDGGKRALADALTGADQGVSHAEVGSGTTAPSTSDNALESGTGPVRVWYDLGTETDTTFITDFRFNEFGDVINELGLWTPDDKFVCRLTTGNVDPTASDEIKIEITVTVSISSRSNVAVTDATAISNSLGSPLTSVGLNEIAIGTDNTDPTTSDTALGNEVIRKNVDHEASAASVTPWTVIFRSQPSTQPHDITELGVIDGTGTLVWRSVFGAETKDDRTRMRPQATLTIE